MEDEFDFGSIVEAQQNEKELTKREPWREEWHDMPEYVNENNPPFSKITIRFATEEDLNDFAKLVGQNLTPKTKSMWHPELVSTIGSFRYADED